jgi:hypothetical protein
MDGKYVCGTINEEKLIAFETKRNLEKGMTHTDGELV